MIDELVRRRPRCHGPTSPSGHWTRTSAALGRPQPEVDPAELAAGVAAADRQLAPHASRRRPGPRSRRRSASRFGPGWSSRSASQWPIGAGAAAVARRRRCATAVTGSPWLTSTRSSRPSRLKSASGRAAAPVEADDARPPRPPRRTSRRAGRGAGCSGPSSAKSGCALDVALGDEQVDEAVVVDVLELRVPGGRGQDVAARERPGRGHAALEGDVAVGRLVGPGGQRLQLVVALAGRGRPPGSRRRSGRGWRCPCPRSAAATQPSSAV